MEINFECEKCGRLFDCNVDTVTLPENSDRPHFEQRIFCPRCGELTIDKEGKKMSMMDKMMGFMMGRMSKEEKEAMMGRMMDKFFADMTSEDKQKMMAEMMPKMMEGINMMEMMPRMMMSMMAGGENKGGMMGMMSEMTEGGKDMEMPMMPHMMMEMMPQCLTMMLPNTPKEKRIDFVLKMMTTLVEQGCAGMSEEEKKGFVEKVVEKARTYE